MKKYIKASTNYNGLYTALKADRRKVASLDPDTTTYEDLNAIEWRSGRICASIVQLDKEKGLSVEECIDDLIDTFQEHLAYCKNEMDKERDYKARAEQLRDILSAFLDEEYNVIDETEFGWIIDPPAGATHEDCIAFVDDVKDAIDGRYHGTGRGGSWSTWDLLSADNVRVKAGWTRDDMWQVVIDTY